MSGKWAGEACIHQGRTVLTKSAQQAPLKLAKPFAGPGGKLLVYLMDSSPGLFNGDRQDIFCTLQEGSNLYLTNQSSCKLHPSLIRESSIQTQSFFIKQGSLLEYFPEPLVPYRGANYQGETVVCLESGGKAFIADIVTPGRAGRGEFFEYERLSSRFSVYWDERLTVWDSIVLEPEDQESMRMFFGEYTHLGTLWVLSERVTQEHVRMLQDMLVSDGDCVYAGVSLLSCNGLVVRMLGYSADRLQAVIADCCDLIFPALTDTPFNRIRK
ncbi:urease accessory protein UreD [Effusibacillus dendaii]|uniref:Urease accessory protein UreD n=1 Tax=Effusibacillus dendaii TaxID=2743772 RepID=A0A7I8D869_9BACL|nr:urease accessory protein UreD [Effusibacillus dendaii]BCJ85209.1 hypothetical protein skT53_01940 [Effusibacillus dendaii]